MLFRSAVIVENVHIGAGAVVVKDIPVNVTVVGVLAKVISYDGAGNKWRNQNRIIK